MSNAKFELLNNIYEPLHKRANYFKMKLESEGYSVLFGYYNLHSVRNMEQFITEYYPIPVLQLKQISVDIGFDVDLIWIVLKLPISKAKKLDYNYLCEKYTVEIYGVEESKMDIFHKGMAIENIIENIDNSKEQEVFVAFIFSKKIANYIIVDSMKELISYVDK